MTKMLVFDMDGTIADLYGVDGWLDDLMNEDTRPYDEAEPLYDMIELVNLLERFQSIGWKIAITSWLAKDSTKAYDVEVRKAKRAWLENYSFPYDEIHLVKYGTRKDTCTKGKADFQILVDDNADVRRSWRNGNTIDANENILEILEKMLDTYMNI